MYRMESHRVETQFGIIAQEVIKPRGKLTWGKKAPTKNVYSPPLHACLLRAPDTLPLLLHVKECDGLCVSKQEVACASVKDLITVGHLNFFGDFIL